MGCPAKPRILVILPSSLGWIALVGAGRLLKQLTFGHSSEEAAVGALDAELLQDATRGTWNTPLVRRLLAYAAGKRVEFHDVRVDPGRLTDFQHRVLHHCRQIPYGQTLTYGELAIKAGSPRAARAVGNCLAANRIPLVIPCHRVVPAMGHVGAFSAPGGTRMKQRLLVLEGIQPR